MITLENKGERGSVVNGYSGIGEPGPALFNKCLCVICINIVCLCMCIFVRRRLKDTLSALTLTIMTEELTLS